MHNLSRGAPIGRRHGSLGHVSMLLNVSLASPSKCHENNTSGREKEIHLKNARVNTFCHISTSASQEGGPLSVISTFFNWKKNLLNWGYITIYPRRRFFLMCGNRKIYLFFSLGAYKPTYCYRLIFGLLICFSLPLVLQWNLTKSNNEICDFGSKILLTDSDR